MGAEGGLGIEITEVFLDLQAGNGIGIVAAPNLGTEAQHTQVKPVTTGCAAFQKNMGSGMEDAAQHLIEAQNIAVCLLAQGDTMTIHIPLYIGNIGIVQNVGHILYDIVPDFCPGQIQKQFVSSGEGCKAIGQRPIGMGPVKIRIRIHRFRLKPKAKFQTHMVDPFAEALDALGQFLLIDRVVAQTGGIVIALAKPAVIQHKQFATQFLRLLGQVQKLTPIKIKHAAFPVVIEHRAFPILPVNGNDMLQDEFVHFFTHSAEAPVGYRQNRFRRFKELTGQQFPAEIVCRNTLHHPGETLQRPLGGCIVVSGVNEIEAIHPAGFLRSIRFAQQESGVVPVGRKAGGAFADHTVFRNRQGMFPHLRDPATVKGGHFQFSGKIHQETHAFADGNRCFPCIMQHSTAGKDTTEDAKIQFQLQTLLSHSDLQLFSLSRCRGQTAGHRNRGFQDLMTFITKIRGYTQVQRAFPIIAPSAAAPGQRHGIRAAGIVSGLQQHGGTPSDAGIRLKGHEITGIHFRAKIKLFQKAPFVYPQQAGKPFPLEGK